MDELDVLQEMKTNPTMFPMDHSLAPRYVSNNIGRWLASIGVVLFSGPLWGLLGTVVGMILAFNTLSDSGVAAPAEISKHVSFALYTTSIGMLVGLVGGAMILVAIHFTNYRAGWFKSWSIGLAIIWCFALFPFGLIVGIPISILFTSRRGEFEEQRSRTRRD